MIQDISGDLNGLDLTSPPSVQPAKPPGLADPVVGEQPSRSWPPELLEALARDREQLRAESALRFHLRRLLRRFALLANRMAARLES
jgi:hypothetical protein